MARDTELIGLPSMVYMFGFPTKEGGYWVKIGRSLNPIDRMKSLQAGCPYEFQLIFLKYGGSQLESKLHETCGEWRGIGEWFHMGTTFAQLALDDLKKSKEIVQDAISRTREYREKERAVNLSILMCSIDMARDFLGEKNE